MNRQYKKWLENNFNLEVGEEPDSLKELYISTRESVQKNIIENCLEDIALAHLLSDGVVFLNNTEETTCVYVLCSDFFDLACADAECVTSNDYEEPSEIIDLYKFHINDPVWGSSKWVAKKRNLQPHSYIKKKMIESNTWENWMEDLTPRTKNEIREKTINNLLNN